MFEASNSHSHSDFPHRRPQERQVKGGKARCPRSRPKRRETSPPHGRRYTRGRASGQSSTQASDQGSWSSPDASTCAQRSSQATSPSLKSIRSPQLLQPSRSGNHPLSDSENASSLTIPTNYSSSGDLDREEILKVVSQVQAYSAHVLGQLACKDSEIAGLKKQMKATCGDGYNELQSQVCKLQASLSCKTTEYIKLRHENAELRTSNQSLLEDNDQLTTDLSERDDALISLKHRIDELKRRLRQEKNTSERFTSTIARLREQVSLLQTEARELIADKGVKLDKAFTIDDRERELRRTYDKVEYLNNVIREHYERNQDLEVENMKVTEVAKQLKRVKVRAEEENNELKKENNNLRKQVVRLIQETRTKQNRTIPATPPPPPPVALFGVQNSIALWKKRDSEVLNWLETYNDPMSAS